MENPSVIFCIRNGGLFCDPKKEPEPIVTGEGKEDFTVPPVRNFLHCFPPHLRMAKILQSGTDICPTPGHLWFLANIFIYVILLSPVFFYLKRNQKGRFRKWLKKVYANPSLIQLVTYKS